MLNIALGSDLNYLPYCETLIISICENSEKSIRFHVFIDQQSVSYKHLLEESVANYSNKEIIFYVIDETIYNDMPVREGYYISKFAYVRLLMPTMLPDDINYFLYLDIDICVVGDICEIEKYIIDKPIGCVKDAMYAGVDNYKDCYFNSGIMLININKWKESAISERALNYIKETEKPPKYVDQDVLNEILKEEIYFLPYRFNAQEEIFKYTPYNKLNIDEKREEARNAIIIHFTGPLKAWYSDSQHPYSKYFRIYYKKTHWSKKKLKPYYKHGYLKKFFYTFRVKIGLQSPHYISI